MQKEAVSWLPLDFMKAGTTTATLRPQEPNKSITQKTQSTGVLDYTAYMLNEPIPKLSFHQISC